jgi:hypothetical protein
VSHFCGTFSNSRAGGLALVAQQEYEQDIKVRMAGGIQAALKPTEKAVSQPFARS